MKEIYDKSQRYEKYIDFEHNCSVTDAQTEAALLAPLSKELACLSVDEVQPRACGAGNSLKLVFGCVVVIIQPVLDAQVGNRAGEDDGAHSSSSRSLRSA
jgi:hypothetical protein